MKKLTARIMSLTLSAFLAVGMLSGCTSKDTKPGTASQGEEDGNEKDNNDDENKDQGDAKKESSSSGKDKIIIATENETPSLHTANHDFVAASFVNRITHNGLFKIDLDMKPAPDLVSEYESISDTQWRFKLKENVKFHDGAPLTSEDVKATLEWSKTFAEVAQYTQSWESVEVVDELTFDIITNGPTAMLLSDLTNHGNFIVPKHLIESDHDFNAEPIGTGPYKFIKWTRGDKLEFEAFDDYFEVDAKPSIKYMDLLIIPEGSSRTIALENKEVDMIIEVATSDVKRLRDDDRMTLLEQPGIMHNYLMLNNERYPFDNVLLRKAINAGIDKAAIVEVATEGLADVVISQAPIGFPGSSDENAEGYDKEQALLYLEQSGVDPSEIVLDIICSNEQKRQAAEIIQANLAEIGISVKISQMDLSTYLDVTSTTDYVASIGNFTATNIITYLYGVHSSLMINSSNRSRFSNQEVDDLMDQAKATIDDADRERLIAECIAIINEEMPQVPLYQSKIVRAFSADLGGVEMNPAGTIEYNKVYWK